MDVIEGLNTQQVLRNQIDGLHNLVCRNSLFLCHNIGLTLAKLTTKYSKNDAEIDPKVLEIVVEYWSHTMSIKQPIHYKQIYLSKKFRQFDYGEENMKFYNSSSPPEYNISNIKVPSYLYSGLLDTLVDVKDVDYLESLLPNVKLHKRLPNYSHVDFNYGKNSRKDIFDQILKTMNDKK